MSQHWRVSGQFQLLIKDLKRWVGQLLMGFLDAAFLTSPLPHLKRIVVKVKASRPCERPLGAMWKTTGGHVKDYWGPCERPLGTMWKTTGGHVKDYWGPCGRLLGTMWKTTGTMWKTTGGHVKDYWGPCERPLGTMWKTTGGHVKDYWGPCERPLGTMWKTTGDQACLKSVAAGKQGPALCKILLLQQSLIFVSGAFHGLSQS